MFFILPYENTKKVDNKFEVRTGREERGREFFYFLGGYKMISIIAVCQDKRNNLRR